MARYHFIGIKGSGMSALASILHDLGHEVQGSDTVEYLFTQKGLDERNICLLPFAAENITHEWTIIQGNAFNTENNVEVAKAQAIQAEIITYYDFLGDLTRQMTSVGIAGTHGKTTTTGLFAQVFSDAAPTAFLIGDGTGKAQESARFFLFESCEYRRHFLHYQPDYAVITNIEHDHPDYFKDLADVLDAFNAYADLATKAVVACGDDENTRLLQSKTPIYFYGLGERNDVRAFDVMKTVEGVTFTVSLKGENVGTFSLPFFGDHMILNSLAVITVAILEGFTAEQIEVSLQQFHGVQRRFNIASVGTQIVVDDYAHHPTEINVTIQALKQKYPDRELVIAFQPHTYSRTAAFLDEFAEILSQADHVYVSEIFASAREAKGSVSAEDLVQLIPQGHLFDESQLSILKKHEHAVIVFMGAGNINQLIPHYKALVG
ncbi:MAG: UDP-N-acetylmuramate--L-alanine ligase [Culicoidibacterales bacterium]